MKRMSLMFVVMLALCVVAGAAQARVLRVVIAETSDSAAYVKELDKVRAHLTRLGSKATVRVWRARFAGADTGSIVVAVDYDDMAALAADDAKMAADAEFQATLKGMNSIRKIVSDSLYEELE